MFDRERVERFFLITLIALAIIFCFYKLSYPDLQKWDETTNANVVYESLHSNRPWILQFEKKPFFEKTPLWYYATMGIVKILGFNKYTLRLVSAFSGFLLILLIYMLGKMLYTRFAGLMAGFTLLATGHLFFFHPGGYFSSHHIRSADSDILQILLIVFSFYAFCRVTKGNTSWIYSGVIASALAVMSKGPMGILPLIVFFICGILSKKRLCLSFSQIALAVSFFIILVMPWHIYMYLQFKEKFINSYFYYHLLRRVISPLEKHGEPWWFYFKLLSIRQVFFSLELLVAAFVARVINRQTKRLVYTRFGLLVTIVLILLIITIVKTKLAWYILPLYPFAALVIGGFLNQLREKGFLYLILVISSMVLFYSVGRNLTAIIQTPKGNIYNVPKISSFDN